MTKSTSQSVRRDDDTLARLAALAADTDALFTAVQGRQGAFMECRAGCSDCCRARLSITRVEAEFLRRGLDRLPVEVRRELTRRTREIGRTMCPALDADGRCDVYAWRPLICRSFGVPLRRDGAVPLVRPATIDSCDKNFRGIRLRTLPASDVIDQTGLDAAVDALDADFCTARGLPLRERVPIAAVLA